MQCPNLALSEKIFSDRLMLQRFRFEDAEEIFYTYASKPEATRFVSFPTHRSVQDTRNYLSYAVPAWDRGNDYSFSVRLKTDNRLIGSFGVLNDNGKLQFGYALSPSHWGKGFATEICRLMMPLLKKQQGVYRIHTFVDIENEASAQVLIKAGLTEEARLHKWFRFINQDNQPKDCILFYLPL